MNLATINPSPVQDCHAFDKHRAALTRIRATLNDALKGKPDVVELVIVCLLARGHLLIEDLPGLGKTTLAKALAVSVGGQFNRVQCTPDLLPGDVTGFSVFNQKTREFEFLPGPVFADVLLVDEINRTTPRTQSALLEAMAEQQVTVDNVRHRLSPTFFVIATQNPAEHHGTYPLPEAQLDRFAMKLQIGYPKREHEMDILAAAIGPCCVNDTPPVENVVVLNELHHLQQHVASVNVSEAVRGYLVDIAAATRSHPAVTLGLSPRGVLTLQRIAQARAFLHERDFVIPDDIQAIAHPVLDVRLGIGRETSIAVVQEIVSAVPVPTMGSR
jgi:MoxR-like ATPase